MIVKKKVNAAKLKAAGIAKPGKIVVVHFDNHTDNMVWTWSVIAAGGVPAILSPLVSSSEVVLARSST